MKVLVKVEKASSKMLLENHSMAEVADMLAMSLDDLNDIISSQLKI